MLADHIAVGKKVLSTEAGALQLAAEGLDEAFSHAVTAILVSNGKAIVSGLGKSGHIARKISATFSSTGTPSIFLHPTEALHGDLGVVAQDDVLLLISNSGETEELLRLIAFFRSNGNAIIAMTSNEKSSLARLCDIHLSMGYGKEACPLNLAPTTSTTLTLALGDALAIALMHAREFDERTFARFHPGGALGKRLLGVIADFATPATQVDVDEDFGSVLAKLMDSGFGVVCVTAGDSLEGIITDGDVRRALARYGPAEVALWRAGKLMTKNPVLVSPTCTCGDADAMMQARCINSLVIEEGVGRYAIYPNLNLKVPK